MTVLVNGDLLDEADENYFVNLTNPGNATITDGQGAGTITDDDALPSLAVNDVTVTDGDSGTVNASFTVSLIPETLARTTLGSRRPGDRVNLEVDIIAKYVERLLPHTGEPRS